MMIYFCTAFTTTHETVAHTKHNKRASRAMIETDFLCVRHGHERSEHNDIDDNDGQM